VSLFRREPLHVRLAREAGLQTGEPEPPPHDLRPRWGEVGIHGIARPRQWDAVVAAEAPRLGVGELEFAVLEDGTLVVDEELEAGSLDPLATALESALAPPYRARAVWRGGSRWAVAGRRIQVVELPESVRGAEIVLSVRDGERSLLVDGQPSFRSLAALERLGATRGGSYVVRAERLDGTTWEVQVTAL
jgi:hypothetical protein